MVSFKVTLAKAYIPFILIILFLSACNTSVVDPTYTPDLKEHFMVNGTLYWQSSFPSGTMPDSFQYVGTIQETVGETPTSNWCSYGLPVGSKIYLDSESPYQAWIDGKYRYRTSDAGREYINHDDSLFVYLGSVSDINDEYYQNYRNRWDFHVDLRNITHDTVYLGETTFEGYACFPVQERGSNCFNKPQNVYSYTNDTNLLLVSSGNDAAVYVKLQGSDSKETGMYR